MSLQAKYTKRVSWGRVATSATTTAVSASVIASVKSVASSDTAVMLRAAHESGREVEAT